MSISHENGGPADDGGVCASEAETLRYFGDELAGEERERAERHLVDCATCRETIAMLASVMSDDLSPEDARLRDELDARTAEDARRLFRTQSVKRTRAVWAYYAIAASVLLAVGAVAWIFIPRPNADVARGMETLRAATRERRPTELRVTGLDYAPYREVRGGASDADRIRDSRDLLLDAVARDPSPEARHALARALVASNDYAGAIAQLELAHAEAPSDAGILADLAVARAATGDTAGAIADLDRALATNPRNAEALFNRGVLRARAGQVEGAREDLTNYLALDATSEWAAEARRRLEEIDPKKISRRDAATQRHGGRSFAPLRLRAPA
jgi:tetratricopeptide (TPR) repeat protein